MQPVKSMVIDEKLSSFNVSITLTSNPIFHTVWTFILGENILANLLVEYVFKYFLYEIFCLYNKKIYTIFL